MKNLIKKRLLKLLVSITALLIFFLNCASIIQIMRTKLFGSSKKRYGAVVIATGCAMA
jgi:hypothetical protein